MREITEATSSSSHDCDSIAHKLQREAYVFSAGTIGGAATEFSKHPVKTVGDTLAMGATAVGLTAIAAAELPVVSIVAAGTGAVCSAGFAWNFINPNNPHNIERNRSLTSAMTTTWNTADSKKLENSIMDLQAKVGPDALQTVQLIAVGGAAGKFSLRTVDVVRGAVNARSMTLATESSLASGARFNPETKAPTWNEYLNFSKRHGPVTQKSLQQFEFENTGKLQTKPSEAAIPVVETAMETKVSMLTKNAKNKNSQGSDDDDSTRGTSLYFSERFGRFHH